MLKAIDATNYSRQTAWCGPSAIATLTGIPLVKATEMATRIHGGTYDDLEGMYEEEVILALNELGYCAREIDIQKRYPHLTHGPTLQKFMEERTGLEVGFTMLIGITGHFVCAHWGWLNDNWTMKPTPLKSFPKTKRLVKTAFVITRGQA